MVLPRNIILTGLLCVLPFAALAQDLGSLVPDVPAKIAGVEAVCTGVGLTARENPAWTQYPLKIEVAGRGGQYLGDVRLALSQGNKNVATLSCGEPWILFRVPAGRYQVEAELEGKKASSAAIVPTAGQGRLILRFPDLGGEISAPPVGDVEAASQPPQQ